MRSEFNSTTNCRIYRCPACSYTHYESLCGKDYGSIPFIKLQTLMYETSDDNIKRTNILACPECGTVQIDLSSI